MTLTVPTAGVVAGRAAAIRIPEPQGGETLARFGEIMMKVGTGLENERLDRERARARVEMMRGLNDLSRALETVGDPDALDAAWAERSAALRAALTGRLDPRLRADAEVMFDELSLGHANRIGYRALEARQSQRRAIIADTAAATVDAAATADPDTRATYFASFDQGIDEMVAAATITPEQGAEMKRAVRANADEAAALRRLSDDPAGLVAAIERGEFAALPADQRERFRARAVSAVEAAAAREAAAADKANRERIAAARETLKSVTAILDADRDPARAAEADALLADPDVAATPEARAYVLAKELRQAMPGFAYLPLDQQRALLAIEVARPIGDARENRLAEAMRAEIARKEAALTGDYWGYVDRVFGQTTPALPDPTAADPAALADALRQRSASVSAQTASRFAGNAPVPYFTPDERKAWTEAVAVTQNSAQRAAIGRAMYEAIGPREIGRAAAEILADPVFVHAAGLAATGNEALARRVLEGQRAAAAGDLSLPARTELRETFFETWPDLFGTGVDGFEDDSPLRDSVIAAANALYALEARDQVKERKDGKVDGALWLNALHRVLGGTGTSYDSRDAAGGIATINGHHTLLPPGVPHRDARRAIAAVAAQATVEGFDWSPYTYGGAIPQIAGQPLDGTTFSRLRLKQAGGNNPLGFYAMIDEAGEVVTDARGRPVYLDLRRTLSATAEARRGLLDRAGGALRRVLTDTGPAPDAMPDYGLGIGGADR
jgi:hypothetical protein